MCNVTCLSRQDFYNVCFCLLQFAVQPPKTTKMLNISPGHPLISYKSKESVDVNEPQLQNFVMGGAKHIFPSYTRNTVVEVFKATARHLQVESRLQIRELDDESFAAWCDYVPRNEVRIYISVQ